jgi:hypothetical protein
MRLVSLREFGEFSAFIPVSRAEISARPKDKIL